MKSTAWLTAYEDRNVDVALAAGFAGTAQIGKGMWAMPAGWPTCWRRRSPPEGGRQQRLGASPTAATLHALHYHQVEVTRAQTELAARRARPIRTADLPWPTVRTVARRVQSELDNNVPVHPRLRRALGRPGHRLLEGARHPRRRPDGGPRHPAHLQPAHRQLAAHGVVDQAQVRQTSSAWPPSSTGRTRTTPSTARWRTGRRPAFQAALDLVFEGRTQPNGYTERALTLTGGGGRRRRLSAGSGARAPPHAARPPRRRGADRPSCRRTSEEIYGGRDDDAVRRRRVRPPVGLLRGRVRRRRRGGVLAAAGWPATSTTRRSGGATRRSSGCSCYPAHRGLAWPVPCSNADEARQRQRRYLVAWVKGNYLMAGNGNLEYGNNKNNTIIPRYYNTS